MINPAMISLRWSIKSLGWRNRIVKRQGNFILQILLISLYGKNKITFFLTICSVISRWLNIASPVTK